MGHVKNSARLPMSSVGNYEPKELMRWTSSALLRTRAMSSRAKAKALATNTHPTSTTVTDFDRLDVDERGALS
jgi:hypothetical protein